MGCNKLNLNHFAQTKTTQNFFNEWVSVGTQIWTKHAKDSSSIKQLLLFLKASRRKGNKKIVFKPNITTEVFKGTSVSRIPDQVTALDQILELLGCNKDNLKWNTLNVVGLERVGIRRVDALSCLIEVDFVMDNIVIYVGHYVVKIYCIILPEQHHSIKMLHIYEQIVYGICCGIIACS